MFSLMCLGIVAGDSVQSSFDQLFFVARENRMLAFCASQSHVTHLHFVRSILIVCARQSHVDLCDGEPHVFQ